MIKQALALQSSESNLADPAGDSLALHSRFPSPSPTFWRQDSYYVHCSQYDFPLLRPSPPKCWGYRHAGPHPALCSARDGTQGSMQAANPVRSPAQSSDALQTQHASLESRRKHLARTLMAEPKQNCKHYTSFFPSQGAFPNSVSCALPSCCHYSPRSKLHEVSCDVPG